MPPTTPRPSRAKRRPVLRRALPGALPLLLVLLGLTAVPAPASAAELDAITGVEITRPTGELQRGDSIRLDATWSVPDDASAGDTFRLVLPTAPRVVGTPDAFDLADPAGSVVGTCAVDATQILCTLGEYVATHTAVAGTLFFWAEVTETSTSEVLVFRTGGGAEIHVDVPGGIGDSDTWGWGPPASPVKNAWFDAEDGRAHWQVNVPGQYLTGPDGEPVVVTDTFDPRLTLVVDSMRAVAVPVDRWNRGDFWGGGFWLDRSQYVIETGPAANQFRFSVPGALGDDHVYVLVYATEVPEDARDGDRYRNSISGTGFAEAVATAVYAGGAGTGRGEAVRSIRLTKQVDGDDSGAVTGPFVFELVCRGTDGTTLDGFPRAAAVSTGATTTFTDVPVGALCALTETEDGGADRVALAPAGPIAVTADSPMTIDVVATNTFDTHAGGLAVTKRVTGTGAGLVPDGTPFTVDYAYEDADGEVSGELVVSDGSTTELTDLPAGTVVTLSEARPGPVDGVAWQRPSFAGAGVEALDDGTARVVVGASTTVRVVLTNEAVTQMPPDETDEPSDTADAPPATTPKGGLPATGTSLAVASLGALVLVAAGTAAVVSRRRFRA
ncbi:DUF5979 domain-containing protein [Cellulosimicrobium sp. NPDC057127]|uniref:DUF5979 domain-containing protein n=1 Tax=Cellulosimicrobium sp. NPDC057127 TaxID=3346026 RepID=UPI003626DE7E